MNINSESAIRECTSCQMCAAVCGKNAISIYLDADGFYRPIIDENLCVDCGLCTKVCYKFEKEIKVFENERLMGTILYGASAKQKDIVSKTTSGGIADLLAHQLMAEGYKCVGVVYDSRIDKPVDYIASSEEDLSRFRGSKYVQSFTLDAFKEVVKSCKNEKYAIFGTPCHIFALDKFLRQRGVRDNCILIDLYCHGCPSMNIWSKYVKGIRQQFGNSKINNANFRSKIHGWGNFYVGLDIDGSSTYYSTNKHNEFFDLFFSDLVLNAACNECSLRSTLEYTDIRLGDFWGKQYVLNLKGVSAVSLVNDNAKALFRRIEDEVDYKEEKYENFLPWQSWGKTHKPKENLRSALFMQLRDEKIALKESLNTIYRQQSIKRRMVRYVKNIVHLMPLRLEKYVRWIFYKL